MIPIFDISLGDNEKKYVKDCLNTNWISSQGKYVNKFEKKIANFYKSKYCIVTSSCTTALHLSLNSIDIKPGDEVICPALTFISPANMIALSGANLVLIDIDRRTLNIDVNKIENKITKRTKAIIVVHQFGHAAEMNKILKLKRKYNLKIIEDNAESFGGYYNDKILGGIGDISVSSFFGNKIITTGEGGALVTNNKNIYLKAKSLRDHGMSLKKKYMFNHLGFNYRLTNMQAAIGLGQIENIKSILSRRKKQMDYYYAKLKDIKMVETREYMKWCTPVHWLMTIHLKNSKISNSLKKFLLEKKIETRKMITPVYEAKQFKNKFNKIDYAVTENISKRSLHLPSGNKLSKKDIDKIVFYIREFFR